VIDISHNRCMRTSRHVGPCPQEPRSPGQRAQPPFSVPNVAGVKALHARCSFPARVFVSSLDALHVCPYLRLHVRGYADTTGAGVGEDVGPGAPRDAGLAGPGAPARGAPRPDLPDGAGDSGAVYPVEGGQGLVRELEPQVSEGDDDPVGEREVVARPGTGRTQPRVAPAGEQPVLPGGRPWPISLPSRARLSPVQIRFDKAARASPDDTSRSFRAAAHVPGDRHAAITRYAPEVLSRTKS